MHAQSHTSMEYMRAYMCNIEALSARGVAMADARRRSGVYCACLALLSLVLGGPFHPAPLLHEALSARGVACAAPAAERRGECVPALLVFLSLCQKVALIVFQNLKL